MKEATGELNMTLVTVVAVAAILIFVTAFVPDILENITNRWGAAEDNAEINDAAEGSGHTSGGQIIKDFN